MNLTSKYLFIFIILITSLHAEIPPLALENIIRQLPEWKPFSKLEIEKIETGMTNQNYKVIFPTNAYFVRMGNDKGEFLGINPDREYICTKEAASLGIAPEIFLYLPEEHAMVMPFIESQSWQHNRSSRQRILSALRQFHLSGKILPTTFCPYGIIHDYYTHAKNLRADHQVPFASMLLPIVEEIRDAIPQFRQIAPCHLDLFSRNFLDDGTKMWIIDWEYSAMADPIYDLATWISADNLSSTDMQELLDLYLDSPTPSDFAYLYLLSILADIRWGFWSLIQAEISKIDVNYAVYAESFFYQALQKASHPYYREAFPLCENFKFSSHSSDN